MLVGMAPRGDADFARSEGVVRSHARFAVFGMTASEAVGGLCLFLAIVFASSVVSKILAIRKGELELLLSVLPGPDQLHIPMLIVLLAVELGAVALLTVVPPVGLVLSTGLFALYAGYIATIPDRVPCHCFGNSFEFGSRKVPRVARNIALLSISVGGLFAFSKYGASPIRPTAIGAAAVAMLFAVSVDVLFRVSHELSRRRAAFPERREVLGRHI